MFVNSPVVIYNICECLFQFNCRCRQLHFNMNSMVYPCPFVETNIFFLLIARDDVKYQSHNMVK